MKIDEIISTVWEKVKTYVYPRSHTVTLGIGTDIPANSDLDSYSDVGNYVCGKVETCDTLSNCPVSNVAFTLKVFSGVGNSTSSAGSTYRYPYQVFIPYRASKGIWLRTGYTGSSTTVTWYDWYQIPTMTDSLTADYFNGKLQRGGCYITPAYTSNQLRLWVSKSTTAGGPGAFCIYRNDGGSALGWHEYDEDSNFVVSHTFMDSWQPTLKMALSGSQVSVLSLTGTNALTILGGSGTITYGTINASKVTGAVYG